MERANRLGCRSKNCRATGLSGHACRVHRDTGTSDTGRFRARTFQAPGPCGPGGLDTAEEEHALRQEEDGTIGRKVWLDRGLAVETQKGSFRLSVMTGDNESDMLLPSRTTWKDPESKWCLLKLFTPLWVRYRCRKAERLPTGLSESEYWVRWVSEGDHLASLRH